MRQDGRGARIASRRSPHQRPRRTTFVRWFDEIDRKAIPQVGGKGANLGELARAGLPVPAGFVVTVDAYRAFVQASDVGRRAEELLCRLKVDDSANLTETSRASP